MTLPAVLTLVVIAGALVLMMTDRVAPDVALLGAVVLLSALGVLPAEAALAGFGAPAMLTVAALFVVAAGLSETGAVSLLTTRVLGRPRGTRRALLRLTGPVVFVSAFLNNTTVVAALLPGVRDWAARIGVPASRLLLPLSYAALLGGTCTLIGTSTNLVVAGMVMERLGTHPGLVPLGMFDLTWVGIPVALVGIVVIVMLGPWLLPDRRPPVSADGDPSRYAMEAVVPVGSRLAGLTIEDAGLRHLPGAFLMEIVRGDKVLPAVDGSRRLDVGDRLVFVGDASAAVDLHNVPGLAAADEAVFTLSAPGQPRVILEAVVSHRNPLVGSTIRDAGFRTRYHAVVIAVARSGERLSGRIGDIVLRAGDVLLLEAQPDFLPAHRRSAEFYFVNTVGGGEPRRAGRAGFALLVLLGFVVTAGLDVVSSSTGALLAAGLMVAGGCLSVDAARRAPDLQVLVAIAASFGLGHAMQSTGLAAILAGGITALGPRDPLFALVLVYLATAVLTELLSNNAAAVLSLPFALALAQEVGAQPMPFVIVVTMAASASFVMPIGYQTHLMVMGPGGYRPSDFPRLGLPLSLACAVTTLLIVPRIWPL